MKDADVKFLIGLVAISLLIYGVSGYFVRKLAITVTDELKEHGCVIERKIARRKNIPVRRAECKEPKR